MMDTITSARGIAEFHQPRVDAAGEQELCILGAAVLVHAAAGMAALLVARVQAVMLGRPGQLGHEGLQRLVVAPGAALAAVGCEGRGVTRTGTQAWQLSQWGR